MTCHISFLFRFKHLVRDLVYFILRLSQIRFFLLLSVCKHHIYIYNYLISTTVVFFLSLVRSTRQEHFLYIFCFLHDGQRWFRFWNCKVCYAISFHFDDFEDGYFRPIKLRWDGYHKQNLDKVPSTTKRGNDGGRPLHGQFARIYLR